MGDKMTFDKLFDGSDAHNIPFPFSSKAEYDARDADLRSHAPDVSVRAENAQTEFDNERQDAPEGFVLVPIELSAEKMRNIQMHTEIGSYICANWTGAYDCINKLYAVMIAAAPTEITK